MDDDLILNIGPEPPASSQPKKRINSIKSCISAMHSPEATTKAPLQEEIVRKRRFLPSSISAIAKKPRLDSKVKSSVPVKNEVDQTAKPFQQPGSQPRNHMKPGIFTPSAMVREAESVDIATVMSGSVDARCEAVFSDQKFATLGLLHPHLVSCLRERLNVITLTEIQKSSIHSLLKGRDGLIKAQTGSGKTLAYALPIVQSLQARDPPITRLDGTFALIITPTRELATQTLDVFLTITRPFVRIVTTNLIGGTRKKSQKASLRKGANILIATPKRLLDHLGTTSCLSLEKLSWLVVDEADRLLEMGFEKDVAAIIDRITKNVIKEDPDRRIQTVLLSATLTEGVEKLAGLALTNPAICSVTSESGLTSGGPSQFALPAGLKHYVITVPRKLRLVALAAFLLLKCRYNKKGGKVIVFFATQQSVDFHNRLFQGTLCASGDDLILPEAAVGMQLFQLHGSMEHEKRQSVFKSFSSCPSGVLLTTDVASRGLDLSRVAWVVQYHTPGQTVDYVHRVGRTARAGGKGKALVFLEPGCEMDFVEELGKIGVHLDRLGVQEVFKAAMLHLKNVKNIRNNKKAKSSMTFDEGVAHLQRSLEDYVESEPGMKELAESAYVSFIRSYASIPREMRVFFNFQLLHIGHVAKSFCLRETPRHIVDSVLKKTKEEKTERKRVLATKLARKKVDVAKRNMMAEFGL